MEGAWDLQAVDGDGYTTNPLSTTTTMDDYSVCYFSTSLMMNNHLDFDIHEQDQISDDIYSQYSYSDICETSTTRALKELEDELCEPILFSNSFQPTPSPNKVIPNFSFTQSLGESSSQQQQKQQNQHQQQKQLLYPALATLSTANASTTTMTASRRTQSLSTPKLKKRKIQQKRVVCQVPAEGVSSDMWAWRKYGQKPIKGSPYPRGYYRCSSLKGCMAKKLVERSFSDPAMFLITYKAEHNHPIPTHRNSLAGSTRNKLMTTATSTTPAASLMVPSSTMKDNKLLLQQPKQEESREDHLMRSNDDLFMGLEMLNGPTTNTTTSNLSAYSHLRY